MLRGSADAEGCADGEGCADAEGAPSGSRLPLVVPTALCDRGGALHRALRMYKDAPAVQARHDYAELLAVGLGRFLAVHWECLRLSVGAFDAVATVPSSWRWGRSSCDKVRTSPVDGIVGRVRALSSLPRLDLGTGAAQVGHLRPDPAAFVVGSPVEYGARVLLVDDVWTTGAHALSAASAVNRAGGRVAAIVVVARVVNRSASIDNERWWREAWAGAQRSQRGRGPRRPCGLPACRALTDPSSEADGLAGAPASDARSK